MPKIQNTNRYLRRVLNSQCFSKSVVTRGLLKYLVEQSLKGEAPKEFEIAYHVFGKTSELDKENNIRIYIHRLRKKLSEYYQKEGLDDEIRFSIPKGGYLVVFTPNRQVIIKTRLARLSPYFLSASILVLITAILLFSTKDRPKVTKHFIWKDFHQSPYPVLVVLGDHYFFKARTVMGSMGTIRYFDINSDEDFEGLLKKHPEAVNDLLKTEQTYINKQAPFGLYKIMSFLGGGQTQVDIRYSSDLQWEHLKNRNVIFIGSYKTQNILKKIHEKIGIFYKVNDSMLYYQTQDSTIIFDTRSDNFLKTEYASFSRFVTNDGRSIVSFMCDSDVGNIATLKFISEPENLKRLEEMANQLPSPNFKAVFEVRGQKDTDFDINIKRLDPIEAIIDEIWP